jgi:hypothetical protein
MVQVLWSEVCTRLCTARPCQCFWSDAQLFDRLYKQKWSKSNYGISKQLPNVYTWILQVYAFEKHSQIRWAPNKIVPSVRISICTHETASAEMIFLKTVYCLILQKVVYGFLFWPNLKKKNHGQYAWNSIWFSIFISSIIRRIVIRTIKDSRTVTGKYKVYILYPV